jgi:hypothetical protein
MADFQLRAGMTNSGDGRRLTSAMMPENSAPTMGPLALEIVKRHLKPNRADSSGVRKELGRLDA